MDNLGKGGGQVTTCLIAGIGVRRGGKRGSSRLMGKEKFGEKKSAALVVFRVLYSRPGGRKDPGGGRLKSPEQKLRKTRKRQKRCSREEGAEQQKARA